MYQIEELPDLKVAWHESYKCLNELLLEYVWEVANHFLPDYAETDTGMIPVESSAPAIFANRYAERNLSVEERYERSKEMKTFKGTLEEYKKREYRKLDDSFKEKFLTNEDLQNTIEAYKLDVSKFWYWKIQCKLPPKTKRFCPLKTFNNAPLKSLDRWGYYYFRFLSV